jgi:hypothetical protein
VDGVEEKVVDKAGLAGPGGDGDEGSGGEVGEGFEGVGVDDGGVVEGEAGGGLELLEERGVELDGVLRAFVDGVGDVAEGLREGASVVALGGGEVAVAGAEGEAVGVADGGADDEVEVEVEVADHGAEDGDLGGVFLAEEGAVGGEDVEELGDDGSDAAEVVRARGAVEAAADVRDVDEGLGAGRVHLVGGGGEEEIDAFVAQKLAVFGEGAGIAGEVFGRGELGGVDEDGGGDAVAAGTGGADEGEVAFVQRAHGGDEAEGAAGVFQGEGASPLAGRGDGGEDLHHSASGVKAPALWACGWRG